MKKTVVVIGCVAVMLLSVTSAFAQCPGFGPRWGERPCSDGPCRGPWEQDQALNLTAEQKSKISDLRAKFKNENAQLIGSMVTKRIELQSLWSNPTAEDKAIQEKTRELRELQNQMKDKALQIRLEIRKILTPEQISKMGSGRGFGPGFGGGSGGGFGRAWGKGMGPGPRSWN